MSHRFYMWVKRIARDDIASSVQKMLEECSDPLTPFSGRRPGKGRFQAFLRRHTRLSVRKPKCISNSRLLVMEPCIRKWFTTLDQIGWANQSPISPISLADRKTLNIIQWQLKNALHTVKQTSQNANNSQKVHKTAPLIAETSVC